MSLPRLLATMEEGAESLGVCRSTIFEMARRGELRTVRIGRSRRVPFSELERWVADQLAAQNGQGDAAGASGAPLDDEDGWEPAGDDALASGASSR